MSRKILNYLYFQIGWTACILGVAHHRPWIAPMSTAILIAIHFLFFSDQPGKESLFMAATSLIGCAMDLFFIHIGVYSFPPAAAPMSAPILFSLWLLFSSTINSSLSWLKGRYILAALLGFIGSPLSYLSGSRLGAIIFQSPIWPRLIILGVAWAVAVPLMTFGAVKFMPETRASQ